MERKPGESFYDPNLKEMVLCLCDDGTWRCNMCDYANTDGVHHLCTKPYEAGDCSALFRSDKHGVIFQRLGCMISLAMPLSVMLII